MEESTGDILYTVRIKGDRFLPKVYAEGKYTVRAGKDRPDQWEKSGLLPSSTKIEVEL